MSKQRIAFFVFVLAIFVVSASGCSVVDWILGKYSPVHGAWKYNDNAFGPEVITMHKDDTYSIDWDGDGVRDVWGVYNLSAGQVTFRERGGDSTRPCQLGGVYHYKVERGELSFVLIGDECAYRLESMNRTWVRVHR